MKRMILQICRLSLACLLALPTAQLLCAPAAAATASDETLILSKESLYNNIYVYRRGPYVSLTFGHNRTIYTESVCNTWDELELPVLYTQYMTVGLAYPPAVHSVLEIGFGGGRTSWYLHRTLPEVSVTTVELDGAVVDIAKQYFGIKEEHNFHIQNEDGRLFLTRSKEQYDLILLDAYRGPFVPFHLLTKEFYAVVKQHLKPGGVIVQNVEPSTMLFDSSVATMGSVFANMDFFRAEGNIVVVAYDGAARDPKQLAETARQRDAASHPRYYLTQLLAARQPYAAVRQAIAPGAKVLTDDFAPVEYLKAIENHNRKWPSVSQ
jgi:spermidine synthase